MKPGREMDLGWTFKWDTWEGKIQLGCAGRVQDHLLESKRNTMSQALTLTQEAAYRSGSALRTWAKPIGSQILSPHL